LVIFRKQRDSGRNQDLNVSHGPWKEFGDWGVVHLVLPVLSPGESPTKLPRSDAVMGMLEDDKLSGKRETLRGKHKVPFEYIVPRECQPKNWHPELNLQRKEPIEDRWGNRVIFADTPITAQSGVWH
jgi:hypothetical protein